MAIVKLGPKSINDSPFEPEMVCFVCEKQVIDTKNNRLMPGGYWFGPGLLCICSNCARNSNLYQLGAVLGDAIISNYQPQWERIDEVVSRVMIRLERSVLQAITFQLQKQAKGQK
jgi:hypothetical protein